MQVGSSLALILYVYKGEEIFPSGFGLKLSFGQDLGFGRYLGKQPVSSDKKRKKTFPLQGYEKHVQQEL